MKKIKEDLITPPWAYTKPATADPIPMVTLWLTKNGKTHSMTKPAADVEYWQRKYGKDYTVSRTDPAAVDTESHCGHECFRKRTGVGCSRCKK